MAGNCTKLCFIAIFLLGLVVEAQEYAVVREQKLFGYIDRTGHYAIEPRFKEARSFSNGLAAVKVGKKWGYIDAKGNEIIKPLYTRAGDFDSGIALVEMDGQRQYIKKDGNQLKVSGGSRYYDFKNGVAVCGDGEKKGLIGTDGKWIVKPKYEVIQKFVNKHAKVRLKGLWGIIDTEGNEKVPLEYDNIGNYHPNGLWAKRGKTFGVIMKDGVFQPVVKVDRIWDFQDGASLTICEGTNNKFGFIDGKGNWVIQPEFKEVSTFQSGLTAVIYKGWWRYMDQKGKFPFEGRFKMAMPFSENGLAIVLSIGKGWEVIDKTGERAFDAHFTPSWEEPGRIANGFKNGWVLVMQNMKYGFMDETGAILGEKWYKHAEPYVEIDNP